MNELYENLIKARKRVLENRLIFRNYCSFLRRQGPIFPLISVVCVSKRFDKMENVIKNFSNQSYPNIEFILILQNLSDSSKKIYFNEMEKLGNIFKIISVDAKVMLGDMRERGLNNSNGEFVAMMDDDDIYMENYLLDAYIVSVIGGYDIVGKSAAFYYFEKTGSIYLRSKNYINIKTYKLRGGSLFFKADLIGRLSFGSLACSEDSYFLKQARFSNYKAFGADPFNHIVFRSGDLENHTYKRTDDSFISDSDFLTDRANLKILQV